MARSKETIRLEQECKSKIMNAATSLMDVLQCPVVVVCKDKQGRLTLWENPQPFNDVMDFEYSD